MSTRDITSPHDEKKGDVNREKNASDRESTSTEKTGFYHNTESIRQDTKKRKLLLISEPTTTEHKTNRHNALPFILFITVLGISTIIGLIGLNLKTQKTKTVDFYFSEAKSASRRLKEGAELFSQKKFTESRDRFIQAEGSLKSIDSQLWFVPISSSFSFVDPRLRGARAAVQASIQLAHTGTQSAQLGSEVLPYLSDPHSLPMPLTKYIESKRREVEAIADSLSNATNLLSQIDSKILPQDFVDEYTKAFTALATISDVAVQTTTHFDGIMDMLGATTPHTFLVVLQNSSELRPTGGFIGNVALVQFDKGKLRQQQVIDVYSFDHQLKEIITPPDEIKMINNRWFMRDSNSSLDFPTSAQNIVKFLEKEGGPKVDTVVTIDQTVVENLLRVTGPLKIDELSSELTSENFERVLSFIVEAKIYGREDPKVLLKSLLPAVQKATLDSKKALDVYQILAEAVTSKHSMAYSSNERIQNIISSLNASGKAKIPTLATTEKNNISDFFAVAHFSIGGNKTDRYMKEKITHNTFIQDDQRVINEVTIARTNTWSKKHEDSLRAILAGFGFKEIPEHVLHILGKSWNIHMLRVYVPKGSVLEEREGLEGGEGASKITTHDDPDMNATYFSLRLDVAPGDTNAVTLRYTIPAQVEVKNSLLSPGATVNYNLNIIKQPSQDNVEFEKNIFPPNGLRVQSNTKNTFTLTRDMQIKELLVR